MSDMFMLNEWLIRKSLIEFYCAMKQHSINCNILNILFVSTQENLIREQTQQHDETYYLWALSFFMAFNRGNGFRADLVSETMSIRAFHFIERNITNYYEMILTDRKEATSWSRR